MKKISKGHGNVLISLLTRVKTAEIKNIKQIEKKGFTPLMTTDYCANFYDEIIDSVISVTRKY